ncbi:MAG TPA: SMC-Scp complex subunit ScpB [Polyangia bacterium]|nr:SMC-Scp complex subunit ScpB [Polyangia bacterium]
MSKRKNKTQAPAPAGEPAAPAEGAFDEEATEESTNPDLDAAPVVVADGEDDNEDTAPFEAGDTQTGDAPVSDWDTTAGVEAGADTTAVEPAIPAAEQSGAEAPSEANAGDPGPAEAVPAGRLGSIIESLLFASDKPLGLNELKRLLGERDGAKVTAAIEELRERRRDTGVHVISVAGGWHLRTNPENVAWVSRILAGKPPRLSRAMLETLAIVAYRQPITRPEIDEIRGVDCGPVLKTLLERNLVRMIGKKEEVGRPLLYGTTPEFLRTFSLGDLSELPTLREFHELGEAEMAKVDAAAPAPEPVAPAAPPPPKPVIRTLDPAEEDELMDELERATEAAAKAAAAPPTEGEQPPAEEKPAG